MYEEKDYIMRIISEIIWTALRLVFGKNFGKDKDAVIPAEHAKQYKRLSRLVDEGDVDSAENLLIENMDNNDLKYFQMGLLLYLHMNEKSETFLKEHDFSKKEIIDGVKYLVNFYGYGGLIESFVEDFDE